MSDAENLVGQRLGQYELLEELSHGRIGQLYEAYQPGLKRRVTVRVLRDGIRADPIYRDAFLREAEILAALEHPHIIPIHDCGIERDIPYLVMRLMKGGLLDDRIRRGQLSLQESATIVKQIGGALEYVHAAGYTHGFPSPGNIVFDNWGSPYLGGFMNANLPPEAILARGSRAYSPPERLMGEKDTPASDQYGLASTAYEMLTSHTIFGDALNLPPDLVYRTPPQSYRPEIPLAVNTVLERALAKKPEDRYPTIMDFAREFEKALEAAPQHVFISYSRRDKTYAAALTEHLKQTGFNIWMDNQIEPSDAWFEEIDKAINTSCAFILIMSPDARESEWVRKEILLAKRYQKPIFPLLLAGEEFPIVIDLQFADVKDNTMPGTDFHRRLRRAVFGEG